MESEGQFQGIKWGVFSTVLLVRTSFYLMNRNYSIKASSVKNYPPSTLGSETNHENQPFYGQTPYNFDLL